MSRPIPPQPAPKPKGPTGPGRDPQPKKGKWMTVSEAVEYSAYCSKTIRTALRRGELVGHQPTGVNGTWRIQSEAVDSWIRGERKRRHLRSA